MSEPEEEVVVEEEGGGVRGRGLKRLVIGFLGLILLLGALGRRDTGGISVAG